MAYLTDLQWVSEFQDYTPEEQKVLLALSHENYKWRSKSRLRSLTKLDEKVLDSALAHLMEDGVIRPSFSKKRNIIFGLRERVGS